MPIHDWQFWVVTIVSLAALLMLRRVLMPRKKGKKTTLTVGGQPVGRNPKRDKKDCGCS